MKKAIAVVMLVGCAMMTASAADLASDANYKAKCAMCHGAAGEGKPGMKTAPLKDSASKSDADLTALIAKGKAPKMPAFEGKLKPEEIKAMVAEIKAAK
jgi:mono/diheme cytochrome c family protein